MLRVSPPSSLIVAAVIMVLASAGLAIASATWVPSLQPEVIRSVKYVWVVVPPFGADTYFEATSADYVYVSPVYANLPFFYSWGYVPNQYYWIWTGNPNPGWLEVVYQVTLTWY